MFLFKNKQGRKSVHSLSVLFKKIIFSLYELFRVCVCSTALCMLFGGFSNSIYRRNSRSDEGHCHKKRESCSLKYLCFRSWLRVIRHTCDAMGHFNQIKCCLTRKSPSSSHCLFSVTNTAFSFTPPPPITV